MRSNCYRTKTSRNENGTGTSLAKNELKKKASVWKRRCFCGLIVICCIFVIGGCSTENEVQAPRISGAENGDAAVQMTQSIPKISVADFSDMSREEIENWAAENQVAVDFNTDYSDSVAEGAVVSQSKKGGEKIDAGAKIKVVLSKGPKPSMEYLNALKQAETYSDMMHMSKKGVYDQLTSQFGGQFSKEAAEYAIEHINADWNKNALASAQTYQQLMNMSKKAIYDQLVSSYGGKFTAEEAQYAIDHLDD